MLLALGGDELNDERESKEVAESLSLDEKSEKEDEEEPHRNTLMMKLIGPVVTFVDRPWKMYPVGVLFGFGRSFPPFCHVAMYVLLFSRSRARWRGATAGFDTASSIALLALSAIAKREPDGQQINPADIVILPVRVPALRH